MPRIPVQKDGQRQYYDPQTGKYYTTAEGSDSPPPTTRPPAEPASPSSMDNIGFQWKGSFREMPLGPRATVLDLAPAPAFAKWLLGLLLQCRGLPLPVPPYGYADAQQQLAVRDVRMTFGPLGEVQNWCLARGLFDLSTLIVRNTDRTPGAGYYRGDCRTPEEWREYMNQALKAIAPYRAPESEAWLRPHAAEIGAPGQAAPRSQPADRSRKHGLHEDLDLDKL